MATCTLRLVGDAIGDITVRATVQPKNPEATLGASCGNGVDVATSAARPTIADLGFAAGDKSGTARTLTATICDDSAVEPNNESFEMVMNVAGAVSNSRSFGYRFYVVDNEPEPEVKPEIRYSCDVQLWETAGTAGCHVNLTAPATNTVTFTIRTGHFDANPATGGASCDVEGADYVITRGRVVTFEPGEMSTRGLLIEICDDNVSEDPFETVTMMADISGMRLKNGHNAIEDDENPAPSEYFTVSTHSSGEEDGLHSQPGDQHSGTIYVDFTPIEAFDIGGFKVAWRLGSATATVGSSCTSGVDVVGSIGVTGNQRFTVAPGHAETLRKRITVCDDSLTEPEETFRINYEIVPYDKRYDTQRGSVTGTVRASDG